MLFRSKSNSLLTIDLQGFTFEDGTENQVERFQPKYSDNLAKSIFSGKDNSDNSASKAILTELLIEYNFQKIHLLRAHISEEDQNMVEAMRELHQLLHQNSKYHVRHLDSPRKLSKRDIRNYDSLDLDLESQENQEIYDVKIPDYSKILKEDCNWNHKREVSIMSNLFDCKTNNNIKE